MATYIKTLKEDNGDITYPQTKGSAVLLDGGSDLETVLAAKADASTVNQKITVGDVQSTDIVANAVTTAKIADGAVTPAKIALGSLFVVAPTLSSQKSVAANSYTDSQTITLGAGTWMVSWMIRGFGDSSAHQPITGRLVAGSTEVQALVINALSLGGSLRYQVVGGCIVTPTASTVYKAQIQTPMASNISTSSYMYAIRIG